ncbi:MAG TPA: hypothetical protein DET40_25650 [Lentisphaeria bacterium]|nr:MAG: hypothetical protein A2X45_14735 [Lentisphaerae bacterium GWF2_50_93]HCE46946.1 hypothetical protein [Lentisphaeria bacterium]
MKIKQVVITGQEKAELQDLEIEGKLGPEEILVRTECSFISAGTELSIFTAKESAVFQKNSWCAYPWKSGYANVGTVEAVGAAVTRAVKGQRVFTFGPHASHYIYSQEALVMEVPREIDPGIASASRMAGVATAAMAMADRSLHRPNVAVFGLGMVGNLAAQSFRILGANVIGIDPIPSRRKLAEACGIRNTLAGGELKSLEEGLTKLTGNSKVDICIDAVGHTSVVLQALALTANVGQLILLGTPRAPVEGNLTTAFNEIHLRNICVRGALEWCLPVYPPIGMFGYKTLPLLSLWDKQKMIFEWIKEGQLTVEPMISHRLPPAKIEEAYQGLLKSPEKFTGVVIDW